MCQRWGCNDEGVVKKEPASYGWTPRWRGSAPPLYTSGAAFRAELRGVACPLAAHAFAAAGGQGPDTTLTLYPYSVAQHVPAPLCLCCLQPLADKDLNKIRKEMQRIIRKNLPFIREELSPEVSLASFWHWDPVSCAFGD